MRLCFAAVTQVEGRHQLRLSAVTIRPVHPLSKTIHNCSRAGRSTNYVLSGESAGKQQQQQQQQQRHDAVEEDLSLQRHDDETVLSAIYGSDFSLESGAWNCPLYKLRIRPALDVTNRGGGDGGNNNAAATTSETKSNNHHHCNPRPEERPFIQTIGPTSHLGHLVRSSCHLPLLSKNNIASVGSKKAVSGIAAVVRFEYLQPVQKNLNQGKLRFLDYRSSMSSSSEKKKLLSETRAGRTNFHN